MKGNSLPTPTCGQCGSQLIVVRQETTVLEGQRSPITTTIYRCSNAACQENIDRQTAERLRNQKKREDERTAREAKHLLHLKKKASSQK